MSKWTRKLGWFLVVLLGVWAYARLAWHEGEHLNSAYILIAALCSYTIGYRFYSKWIAARVLMLNDRRATPAEVHDDGRDFVKTNKWILFGHHFAAISGPGPLVGPVLAAQFGYLPGTLWILIGVTLGGAVQDFVVLFCSLRRDGKSLGQMVKEEMNTTAGFIALLAILAIMIILLAVLGLVVVRALAESPWGVFTVTATIPIAMIMGGYLRFWRVGKVLEASLFGVICLLLAVWGGRVVHGNPYLAQVFGLKDITLAWGIIIYGLAASILPVWLLLAPRDYLSTFMKLGTIFALAIGIFLVLPDLQMPAISRFIDGSGPVVAGKVFPFCFITIACGAISGFHTLIASGTTPKLITRESYARPVGYGAMCLESLVAIMALIAACTLEPGVYLGMNMKGDGAVTAAKVTELGFPLTVTHMSELADQIGEKTLFGRTGGAATLAVGMAQIFSKSVSGRWMDLWYHFAIMFEALFILTTIDAGTRVGRYLLQDVLGQIWAPLGRTKDVGPTILASLLIVAAWGYFLVQGVRDPLGGINSLWPLFGIANQMLAAIALCLATTILLKMSLARASAAVSQQKEDSSVIANTLGHSSGRSASLALLTLLPLAWLLAVTLTAGVEKIWNSDPRIGFLTQAQALKAKTMALEQGLLEARQRGEVEQITAAESALRTNRLLHFNAVLDAVVCFVFLALVVAIVILSVREWILLLARRKLARLHESEPVWLPDYAIAENRGLRVAGFIALFITLAKELSGEADIERSQRAVPANARELAASPGASAVDPKPRGAIDRCPYVEMTERRFNGIRRCC
jgi:carbon starvation protein